MARMWSLPRADDEGVVAQHDEPYAPLGSIYQDAETGYFWQYLKAAEALAFGQAVRPYYNIHTVTGLSTAAPAGSRELIDANENFLTSLARVKTQSRWKEMAMLTVVGGTGIGQRGTIIEIQQERLVVEWDSTDGGLATALDTTSNLEIFAPWLARTTVADTATIGFVQRPDGYEQDKYFWALYCGTGTYHTGGAVARGNALTTDASAGYLKPKGDSDDYFAGTAGASIADDNLTWGTLQASLLIGEVPVKTDVGYTPSTLTPAI